MKIIGNISSRHVNKIETISSRPATGLIERPIACPRALTIWRWSRECIFYMLFPPVGIGITYMLGQLLGHIFPMQNIRLLTFTFYGLFGFMTLYYSAPIIVCLCFAALIPALTPGIQLVYFLPACYIFLWFVVWWEGLRDFRETDRDPHRLLKLWKSTGTVLVVIPLLIKTLWDIYNELLKLGNTP